MYSLQIFRILRSAGCTGGIEIKYKSGIEKCSKTFSRIQSRQSLTLLKGFSSGQRRRNFLPSKRITESTDFLFHHRCPALRQRIFFSSRKIKIQIPDVTTTVQSSKSNVGLPLAAFAREDEFLVLRSEHIHVTEGSRTRHAKRTGTSWVYTFLPKC